MSAELLYDLDMDGKPVVVGGDWDFIAERIRGCFVFGGCDSLRLEIRRSSVVPDESPQSRPVGVPAAVTDFYQNGVKV